MRSALNVLVVFLSWLHLGSPSAAPPSIGLGQALTEAQRRTLIHEYTRRGIRVGRLGLLGTELPISRQGLSLSEQARLVLGIGELQDIGPSHEGFF